jgi:hypothetical protein
MGPRQHRLSITHDSTVELNNLNPIPNETAVHHGTASYKALLTYTSSSSDDHSRLNNRVVPDQDVHFNVGSVRIDQRDACQHVATIDPPSENALGLSQLHPVVHAERSFRTHQQRVRPDLDSPERAAISMSEVK